MLSHRARSRTAAALVAALSLSLGCAQVVSRSTVEVLPRSDATSLVLGPPGGEITARGVAVRWAQQGERIGLDLSESRTCAAVRHVPVVRVERVDRRTEGGAMWFEYGLGAGALAVGLAGLIVPQEFSQTKIDANGMVLEDKGTGYRIGGIFTGLGVILLTAAVIDTVRTRDEVLYTDAYRREQGGTVQCLDPRVPMEDRTVELLVGEWNRAQATDGDGHVSFLLPEVEALPKDAQAAVRAYDEWVEKKAAADQAAQEAAAAREQAEAVAAAASKGKGKASKDKASRGSASKDKASKGSASKGSASKAKGSVPVPEVTVVDPGPAPEPVVVKGVLRIDKGRALAVDFVVPYQGEAARAHAGEGDVEPIPVKVPLPRRSDDE